MSIEFIWDTLLQIFQYATITKNKIEYIEDRACLLATKMKKESLEIYNVT